MPRGYKQVRVNGVEKLVHRVLMEQHLGRPLLPNETVHHKNEDKTDNRIENLEVFVSRGEHLRRHKKDKFKYTHEFVLDEIRRVAKELGYTPSCKKEFEPMTGISHSVVDRMFGNWIKAVNLALDLNLQPHVKHDSMPRASDEDLIKDYLRVWDLISHQPTYTEYDKHGKWSASLFVWRYGSWKRFIATV